MTAEKAEENCEMEMVAAAALALPLQLGALGGGVRRSSVNEQKIGFLLLRNFRIQEFRTRCPAWPLAGASKRATAQLNGAMSVSNFFAAACLRGAFRGVCFSFWDIYF